MSASTSCSQPAPPHQIRPFIPGRGAFQGVRQRKAAGIDLEDAVQVAVLAAPDVARAFVRVFAHKPPQRLGLVKVEPVPPAAPFVSRHGFRHSIDPPPHFGSLSFFVMLFDRPRLVGIGQLPADARHPLGFALPAHPGDVAGRVRRDMVEKRLVVRALSVVVAHGQLSRQPRLLPAPQDGRVAPEQVAQLTTRNGRVVAIGQPGGVELGFPGFQAAGDRHDHLARSEPVALGLPDMGCQRLLGQSRRDMRPGAHVDALAGHVPEQPFPAREQPAQVARAAGHPIRVQGVA